MSNLALKQTEEHASNGGRMVTMDGRTLPLTGAALTADAKAGVVRAVLEQRFYNPHSEPLRVTYQVPLPAEGAVSGFAFTIGEQRIVGEIDAKQRARERFEEAVLSGHTAALLEQERSSLFTQEVGNIPPRTEVVAEITIDQKLAFLPEGTWEWRFPTVVAPRYLGAQGRVADAAKVTVEVADQELPVKLALKLSVRDALADGAKPYSPSHPLHAAKGVSRWDVAFGDEGGTALDRDVVVRWVGVGQKVGAELDVARPKDGEHSETAYGLVTLVPPSPAVKMAPLPRDLIVLLDTSGSMGGEPLDQARRIVSALVSTLDERDQLELIEFSSSARRWRSRAAEASEKNKQAALSWLAALRAGGGTEMRAGILEALAPLRKDAQRQVVLVTDGQIGFEHEVLAEICNRLPAGSRVHTVGVGSAVNRSLTQPAARAGRGLEVIVGLGEDAELAARRLLERTSAPLVTEVTLSGSAVVKVAPEHTPDLFAGSPALLSVALQPRGGELLIQGKTANGPFLHRLELKPVERGEGNQAVCALFAREQVEDLEADRAAGQGETKTLDGFIEKLGLQFQISTRLTSWVAVSQSPTVDPRAPKRNETVPHNLPYGMSAEGLGLRPPMRAAPHAAGPMASKAAPAPASMTAVLRRAAAPAARGGMERTKGETARVQSEETLSRSARGLTGADGIDLDAREADQAPSDAYDMPEEQGAELVPEAPTQAPAKRKSGVFDKLGELFKSKAPPRSQPEEAREPKPGERRLKAKVLLNKDGQLVLEVTVEGSALDWAPKMIELHFADGTAQPASIDANATTAPCRAQAGITLVLGLRVGNLSQVPTEAWVTFDGGFLVLDLA